MKEYAITSDLGWWPDTFHDIHGLARDMAYHLVRYPGVEFVIKEREVSPWVDSDVEFPGDMLARYVAEQRRVLEQRGKPNYMPDAGVHDPDTTTLLDWLEGIADD